MSANFEPDWNAAEFFQSLLERNRLAQEYGFVFHTASGLDGFQQALTTIHTAQAMVCVSDTSDGYMELDNTPSTRRVKTVFFAMRHRLDDAQGRARAFDAMRELFRQLMSALLPERTRIAQGRLYIDRRISFTEMDQWFFSGCACAYAQIAVDRFVSLEYRPEEWL